MSTLLTQVKRFDRNCPFVASAMKSCESFTNLTTHCLENYKLMKAWN